MAGWSGQAGGEEQPNVGKEREAACPKAYRRLPGWSRGIHIVRKMQDGDRTQTNADQMSSASGV